MAEIKGLNERDAEQLRDQTVGRQATEWPGNRVGAAAMQGGVMSGVAPLTDEVRRMLSEEITRKAGELVMAIDRAGRRLERAGDYSPQALLQRARERIEDADLYASKALTR